MVVLFFITKCDVIYEHNPELLFSYLNIIRCNTTFSLFGSFMDWNVLILRIKAFSLLDFRHGPL